MGLVEPNITGGLCRMLLNIDCCSCEALEVLFVGVASHISLYIVDDSLH